MQRYTILWADDEIDLLKPHILFLDKKGYDVTPVNSGADAVEACEKEAYDLVFLDENMPGMTGLETLTQIKSIRPSTPVVMITKSEEEHIMEEAIGSKIADYLIKPVNPNQILMSAKKLLENKRLVSERTNIGYQQDFRNISMAFSEDMNHSDWADVYKKLIYWELEIENTEDKSMFEVLDMQKTEANANFTKFIVDNYEEWLNDPDSDRPVMSHQLMRKKVFPELQEGTSTWLLVIDNLRYDQWKVLQPVISEYFHVQEEESYYSILPTTTAYSRNAIFSGMMPTDMAKFHSDIWKGEDDDEGKNLHEEDFLQRQIEKNKLNIKSSYHKILHVNQGRQLAESVHNLMNNDLNVVVYNFVDMLSHARTDLQMIRELAPDEAAYRSLTHSWFMHSPLLDTIRRIGEKGGRLMITTDHGTIRVKKPFKIIGDRNVNTNLRYKQGKNLGYDDDDNVFTVRKPEDLFLPKVNVSTSYAFAVEDYFFAYPNNYNYYVNHYKDTFQHGGISMEEMIIPFITLTSKNG